MLPFFAIVLPVLLLFCGLAIDVAVLQNAQALNQSAADAAVTSAALEYQTGSGIWVAVAKQTAALYGPTDGSQGVTIKVIRKPTAGAFAGRDDALQLSLTRPAPTYFMRFVQSAQTGATATALLPPCILLRGAPALTMTASNLTTKCPVYANGAISLNGANNWSSAGLLLTSSASINANPGVSIASSTRDAGDPLASVAQPVPSACQTNAFVQSGGSANLQPGTYCNGMTLRNATINLSPGLYVITGGAHWTGVNLQGQGVTLFFTGASSGYGQFVIDGNSRVTLSAASDASASAVPGVVVFGDRAWQAQSSADIQITDARVTAQGIWYTTGTGMALTNATLIGSQYLGLDVNSLTVTSSTLQGGADFSSIRTGNPFQVLGGLSE